MPPIGGAANYVEIKTFHGGTACVLTNTNEEVLRVVGLLTRHGVRAKPIQSMNGFRRWRRWPIQRPMADLQFRAEDRSGTE